MDFRPGLAARSQKERHQAPGRSELLVGLLGHFPQVVRQLLA